MTRNLVCFALLAGCFIKPNKVDPGGGGDDDGGNHVFHDARIDTLPPDPLFVPRVIVNANYSDTQATSMNTYGHYYLAVPPGSIHEGDLLVIIGNADNNPTWSLPDASWQQQRSVFYGNDGQTFVVFTKVATGVEPDHYGGSLANISSGAFTVSLLAIPKTGNFTVQHRTAAACGSGGGCGENPVHHIADPVTTVVANTMVIFAGGADWLAQTDTFSTTPPDAFAKIASFGDRDNQDFWWVTQQIAYKIYDIPQTTPQLMASTSAGSTNGQFWALTIAIEPAP
ncbi:MAG: hypothetical protein ABJE66_05695 [Deltaproteobacteria bacterium]